MPVLSGPPYSAANRRNVEHGIHDDDHADVWFGIEHYHYPLLFLRVIGGSLGSWVQLGEAFGLERNMFRTQT